jgi:hypothetical protein
MMPSGIDPHKIRPGNGTPGRSCSAYSGDGRGKEAVQPYSAAAFCPVAVPSA